MAPIVSIILPTFNDLHYIETTLRSICAQSFTNFELIVIDDGSTDESPVRLRSLLASDNRLRYVRRDHYGLNAARNTGLEQAQGRYLTFVEADALLHPAFLYTLVAEADSSKADVVIGETHAFDDGTPCNFPRASGQHKKTQDGIQACTALLAGQLDSSASGRLYRRQALADLRFIPDLHHAEMEFAVRLLPQTTKVISVRQALYGRRRRTSAGLEQTEPQQISDRIRLQQLVKKSLAEHQLWPQLRSAFQQMAVSHLGYAGFKELIHTKEIDWALYLQLVEALAKEGELTLGILRTLPVSHSEKKWVGLPMLHPTLGRWFLRYQFLRQQRNMARKGKLNPSGY
jgi:hypothetical protein